LLKGLQGRFLLSLNDTPEIRRIFADFKIHGLTFSYSSQRKAGKVYNEVLISNYSLPVPTVDTPLAAQNFKNPAEAEKHQNIEEKADGKSAETARDSSPEPRA